MPKDRREAYYHSRIREFGPQYAEFNLEATETLLSLFYTYDLLHHCTARYMAEFGLSKSSVNLLMLLRHGPAEGMQLHDLGEMLLVSRANITGLVDHLEEREYVKRVVDTVDRRARYARITKKAEALLDEFMPVHYRNTRAMLQDLSDDEKKTLVGLLRKARASIQAHPYLAREREESAACATLSLAPERV